ncbi:trigger factor [Granulicella mallensis]|uniref:Trigger factor n=1 Tax=Granulicella mallensis TaxID=940614 RepID=A0A7W8ECK4_9BACT|nr:trigger factor [Granulicella mallensis]MBB5066709.1 trigger factor [Granulicella mallensis]
MTPSNTIQDTNEETLAPAVQPSDALEQSHEGHDHDHAGHDHQHAPTLNPELTHSIEVEAPAADVDKAFRQVIKRYTKLARIPGFRAGKVPEAMIKSRFGKEVRQEVLESLVSDRFRKALEEQKINPVSQPQVSELFLVEGQPLRFKATFEVLPEINIDGYDSISVQRPDSTLTEEEYQAELANVLDRHATVEPVEEDRPLVDGDWAEIGFQGQVQELAQTVTEDGLESASNAQPITGEDVLIEIGGKNTLPAFTEALRGAKIGQELTFEASYPAEFGEARLAGKTVSYDVTVKSIKRKDYPERDEEFAKQLGPYENWGDFETKLREHAGSRKKDALEAQARDKMLDELVEKFTFPLPETFVQQQIDARLERGLRALAQQGMSSDAMRQLDFGRLREAQRDQAVKEVKASMILDRVAERETVEVSDEDLERELLMLSIQSREPYDALRKRLTEDGSLDRIREQMRREKTGAALFEKVAS